MEKLSYSIEHRSTIFRPYERISFGMNFMMRFFNILRLKQLDLKVDDEKLSIEGNKTIKAGDYHIDIKREDFRGASVNYNAFSLLGIIIGTIMTALGIFALIVYFADLFGNDGDTLPLGLGILIIILGIIIIVVSTLKSTTITLRFVDKNSNSVRHIGFKVRRNAKEYYNSAKEFINNLWN